MSLQQMQEAMAELIRLPELNRNDCVTGFLEKYDLTDTERSQVEALSKDRNVTKYGRAMAYVRWETIQKQTPFSKLYWHNEAIEYIWRYRFEATAPKVRFRGLGKAFLDYVVTDKRSQEILDESCPPFIKDLFKFERAQAVVRLESKSPSLPLHEPTLLAHRAFYVEYFDHRISEFVTALTKTKKEEAKSMAPQEGKEILLVIPKAMGSTDCRFFEIDDTIAVFLNNQLHGAKLRLGLPAGYETLVQLGLCRPNG